MIRALRKAFIVLPARLRAKWLLLAGVTTLASAGEIAAASAVFRLLSSIGDASAFADSAILIAVLFLAKNLVWGIAAAMRSGLIAESMSEVFARTVAGFLGEPFLQHSERNSAELTNRATHAVDVTYRLVLGSAVIVISESLVVVGVAGVLVFRSPAAVLVALAVLAGLTAVTLMLNHRVVARTGRASYEGHEAVIRRVTEIFGAITEIRSLGREDAFLRESRRTHEGAMDALRRQITAMALPRLFVETLFVCAAAIALAFAASGAERSLVPLLALYAYAGFRIVPAVNRIVFFVDEIRHGAHAVERLLQEVPAEQRNLAQLPRACALQLERVSFRYGGDVVLRDVDLVVREGEWIAIAGETGSGKSTLLHILAGLFDPDAGSVAIDRRHVAFVPQHPVLLDDTLRRNVAFGLPADDDRIREVLRIAALDALSLDAVVGERGVRLSGGERQRIAIARSLYVQPAILLLDEATSALDPETEQRVFDELAGITPRLTIVAATHRVHSLRRFDRVVYMAGGALETRESAA